MSDETFVERRKDANRRAGDRRAKGDADRREDGEKRQNDDRRRKDRRIRCIRCGRKYVTSAEGPACQCRMDALRTPGNNI